MIRPTRSKARLTLAIVAALAAAPVPAAVAAAPAGDEYVLEIPGVRQTDSGPVAAAADQGNANGEVVQRGVVGETDRPASPLASLGDAIGSIPGSLVAGLAALLALAVLALGALRRPFPYGPR